MGKFVSQWRYSSIRKKNIICVVQLVALIKKENLFHNQKVEGAASIVQAFEEEYLEKLKFMPDFLLLAIPFGMFTISLCLSLKVVFTTFGPMKMFKNQSL